MAIAFARIRYVSRSSGGSACRSSAYNARTKILDERTGEVFDFSNRDGLAYHEVILPHYADRKFQNISVLSNEVEKFEKRKDSQLYFEFLLALDKDLDKNDPETLEIYKAQIYEYLARKGWVKEGLGVQINKSAA